VQDPVSLPAPGRVRRSVQGDHVVFSWRPVEGATGYRVIGPDDAVTPTSRPQVSLPMPVGTGRLCVDVYSVGDGTVSQAPAHSCAP
jgi:hypothetical protein